MPSPSPSLSHPAPETIIDSPAESLCRLSSNRPAVTVLCYTVQSCPVLCPFPPHIRTYRHTHLGLRGFWLRAGHTTSSPTSRHRFSRSNVWAAAASPQPRCTARHWLRCTALAPQARIGLDGGGVGLGCRASERAKRLSYCAARLVSLSLSHHWILSTVHFQISTHWVPPSIPTRLSTPPPQTRLRHLSLPLSSLHLERIFAHLDNSASHFTSTPPFVPSVHHWDGPCSKFLIVWTSLIDRFLISAPRAIP